MHPLLHAALDALHEAAGRPTTGPVIRGQDGSRMIPNSLQRHFGRIAAHAGLHGVSSHSGRRTFLTTLAARNPGRLRTLQRLAGHASESTTVLYVDAEADVASMIAGL